MSTLRTSRALLIAAAAPMALGGCGYNTLPTKDQVVKARWGDVQSTYQRRTDLVNQLVPTVQAAAQNERGTLTDVINARASATQVKVDPSTITDPAQFQKYQAAQGQLSQTLGRLLVVTENYPNLKTNDNFIALQSQIEGIENRINVARRDYNGAAQDYNTTLHTFPSVLWAKTLQSGYKDAQYFSASAQAQDAPRVQFNIPAAGANVAPAPAGAMPGAPAPGAGLPGTNSSSSSTSTTVTTPNR